MHRALSCPFPLQSSTTILQSPWMQRVFLIAVLSAVIFNALIIIALVPLALRGVKYRPMDAASLLRRNLLIYGIGGIIAPFPGIWIIDQLLVALRLA